MPDQQGDGTATAPEAPPKAAVAVDPRMRSRRISVRRDAGRRRLKWATLVLAVVAVVVLALVATRTPLLDVDRVAVVGVDGPRAEAVRAAARIPSDEPLVSLDTGAVADRVEDLPWVASAHVGRSWPSTVRVTVTLRQVVAAVQVTEDHLALVDPDGWVVSIEEGTVTPPEEGDAGEGDPAAGDQLGTPLVLTGIDGPVAEGRRLDGAARDALTIAAAVAERLPDTVASVSTDLDAELLTGGVVRFGSAEDLDEKITAVKTVLSDVDTSCLAVLDVRVPGSPALTRNQGCP